MDATSGVQKIVNNALKNRSTMKKAFETVGIEHKQLVRQAPVDDGVPPDKPKGLKATPYLGSIHVEWNQPDIKDAVETTQVEVQVLPSGDTSVVNIRGRTNTYTKNDLDPANTYQYRVRFIDQFGNEGNWSGAVQAKPLETAQYKIDLQKASMLQTLQGLLPNENLQTIEDATKLGTGIVGKDQIAARSVVAEAMVAQDLAGMRLWVQQGAIENGMIKDLIADKITSGDITANLIRIMGRLEAGNGGVRLDSTGLALTPVEDSGSSPADRAGRKVTNLGAAKWTALYPFDANGGVRGMAVRADGSGNASVWGRVELVATAAGNSDAASTGRIRIDGSGSIGNILIEGNTTLRGSMGVDLDFSARDIRATRNLTIVNRLNYQNFYWGNNLNPGTQLEIPHNKGYKPIYQAWYRRSGGSGAWNSMPNTWISSGDNRLICRNESSIEVDMEVYFYG